MVSMKQFAIVDGRNDWYAMTDNAGQTVPAGHRIIPVSEAMFLSRSCKLPSDVPESITRTQGVLTLHRAGLLSSVQAAVNAAGVEAQLWFESAAWRRASPILNALGAVIGLNSDQIDDLFIEAARID